MYELPKEEDLHPINKAWRLRREAEYAINEKDWDKLFTLAQDLAKQIDICMADNLPNLDGVFGIGTMWYQQAPEKVRTMVDRFNKKLRDGHGKLAK